MDNAVVRATQCDDAPKLAWRLQKKKKKNSDES